MKRKRGQRRDRGERPGREAGALTEEQVLEQRAQALKQRALETSRERGIHCAFEKTGIRMSDVITKFCAPMLDKNDGPRARENALRLGILIWNMAFIGSLVHKGNMGNRRGAGTCLTS